VLLSRVQAGNEDEAKRLHSLANLSWGYDRQLVTHTRGRSETEPEFFDAPKPTETESFACHTSRQRVLSPGEIAQLPAGHAPHLQGTRWGLIRRTPWHRTLPWKRIASVGSRP
jgi:hypothetical protein